MKHVHIRATSETRGKLKVLAVVLGEQMGQLVDRLVEEEAKRKGISLTPAKGEKNGRP